PPPATSSPRLHARPAPATTAPASPRRWSRSWRSRWPPTAPPPPAGSPARPRRPTWRPTTLADLRRLRLQRLRQRHELLLRVPQHHHGVRHDEQLVLDPREPWVHRPLEHDRRLGRVGGEHRHAVDRAARVG